MPVIDQRVIFATRKDRYCDDCGRPLPRGSSAIAYYGMAHEGEKPWWMYQHVDCDKVSKAASRAPEGSGADNGRKP